MPQHADAIHQGTAAEATISSSVSTEVKEPLGKSGAMPVDNVPNNSTKTASGSLQEMGDTDSNSEEQQLPLPSASRENGHHRSTERPSNGKGSNAGRAGRPPAGDSLEQAAIVAGNAHEGETALREISSREGSVYPSSTPLGVSRDPYEGHSPAQGMDSTEVERKAVDTADRVSVEIIRCKAVCPDWQDPVLTDNLTNERPDTLVLSIPHLLLQLPPSKPAVRPSKHPVQVTFRFRLKPKSMKVKWSRSEFI